MLREWVLPADATVNSYTKADSSTDDCKTDDCKADDCKTTNIEANNREANGSTDDGEANPKTTDVKADNREANASADDGEANASTDDGEANPKATNVKADNREADPDADNSKTHPCANTQLPRTVFVLPRPQRMLSQWLQLLHQGHLLRLGLFLQRSNVRCKYAGPKPMHGQL